MKIFALLKWAYATFIILIAIILMIIFFILIPKPYAPKLTARLIKFLMFTPIKLKGEIDPDTQMFLVNHEADIDIVIMEVLTQNSLAWVAKKELFDMPFFGLLLKLPNNIAVERESKTSLIKLLKDAKERLDDGRAIVIFPEGTRSHSGTMRKFKPGAKMIADKYKLKVQPVVLVNTSYYYNIKTKQYYSGTINAVALESFVAQKSDKEWLNNLRDTMQKVYDDELAQLPR